MSKTDINVTHENGLHIDSSRSLLPIQPVGDRIIIDPETPSEYVSEDTKLKKPVDFKEPYLFGKVMSVGNGEYGTSIPERMKPGVKVVYYHQHAMNYIIDKHTYHVVRCSDAWAYV